GTRAADLPRVRERITDAKLDAVERIRPWAEERGHTVAEAAIAWLLAHPVVSSVIAGARTPEQSTANIKAAEWVMTPEERDELTALARGYPVLERDVVESRSHGAGFSRVSWIFRRSKRR